MVLTFMHNKINLRIVLILNNKKLKMEPKTTTTKEEERRGPKITVDNYVETEEMRQQAEVQARKNIRATNVPEINLSEEELKSYGVYQDS